MAKGFKKVTGMGVPDEPPKTAAETMEKPAAEVVGESKAAYEPPKPIGTAPASGLRMNFESAKTAEPASDAGGGTSVGTSGGLKFGDGFKPTGRGEKREILCKKCGKPIKDGVKFCISCGTPIGGEPKAAPSAPVTKKPILSSLAVKIIAAAAAVCVAAAAGFVVLQKTRTDIIPETPGTTGTSGGGGKTSGTTGTTGTTGTGGSGVDVIFTDASKCSAASDSIEEYDFTYQYPSRYKYVNNGGYLDDFACKNYQYVGEDGITGTLMVAAVDNDSLSEFINSIAVLTESVSEEANLEGYISDYSDILNNYVKSRDMESFAKTYNSEMKSVLENLFDSGESEWDSFSINDTKYGYDLNLKRDGEEVVMKISSIGKGDQYAYLAETVYNGSVAGISAVKIILEDDYVKYISASVSCNGHEDYKTEMEYILTQFN